MLWNLWKTRSICSRTWRNFFFFKWLKHVLQINSFPSFWRISGTHTSTALQSGRLFLRIITTLCLYNSWSHIQHLCIGPFPTSLWKIFIKSPSDCCLFLDVLFRSVSCICSHILFAGSCLTICLHFLLHSRSLSLHAWYSVAICLFFMQYSRSLYLLCLVFPRYLLALSATFMLTIPVCLVFPRSLLALSDTFMLIIPVFLVFPSYLLSLSFCYIHAHSPCMHGLYSLSACSFCYILAQHPWTLVFPLPFSWLLCCIVFHIP